MLLATLSALVASFVMRHLQDAGTMEPLQHGLLVYCCVVVVVLLVVFVRHFPSELRRKAEEAKREREALRMVSRELDVEDSDDFPSILDLDVRQYNEVDYEIDVSFNTIKDLQEYEDEKLEYLTANHVDKYRLARLREFIERTNANLGICDSPPWKDWQYGFGC